MCAGNGFQRVDVRGACRAVVVLAGALRVKVTATLAQALADRA